MYSEWETARMRTRENQTSWQWLRPLKVSHRWQFGKNKKKMEQSIVGLEFGRGFNGGGRQGKGVGGRGWTPLLSLQRGREALKITPQQLIRERQALVAEMFVVRLFWLQQAVPWCTGGERVWTHLNALINAVQVSLWNAAELELQHIFMSVALIEPNQWECWYATQRNRRGLHTNGAQWAVSGGSWIQGWKPAFTPSSALLSHWSLSCV